jgi:osmoprotectant transport system permease protein
MALVNAWHFLVNYPGKVAAATGEHILLTLIAAAIAVSMGVALGIYISGKGREEIAATVLYVADIAMTVPSMALFGLLMLILAAMTLPTLGLLPAIIALVIYGQLPILRNTYTAIQAVDPAMIEAAKAMGMNNRQLLTKVELPLAIPVIMAGVRTAVVLIISIATIAALFGAGGLGGLIFRGINNGRMDLIIIGAVGVSILALLADFFMSRVERWVTPKGLKQR